MGAPYKSRGNSAPAHKTSANWQKCHIILEMIDGIGYRAILVRPAFPIGRIGACRFFLSLLVGSGD